MKMSKFFMIVGALALSAPVLADAITDKLGRVVTEITGQPVQSVVSAGIADVYEIRSQGSMFYANKNGDWIVAGTLFDGKTRENKTLQSIKEMQKFTFSDIPLSKTIKIVRGKGERKVVAFEDPNCGYCKKLSAEIAKIDNVTVYVMPLAMLSPDSETKIINILCAPDPGKAWQDSLSDLPVPACKDATKVEFGRTRLAEVRSLGQKYLVQGTPSLFFEKDNQRINGFEPASTIEGHL